MDFSTIDLEALTKLATYTPSRGYHLQDSPGNGCAGDPPGFPTYFTRSVYTSSGNEPRRGPVQVIKLWKPLPYQHPRVQAWIRETYRHMAHCYTDDKGLVAKPEYGKSGMLIYSLDGYTGGLKTFVDDPRFSDEWRTKEKAAIEQFNAERRALAAQVAVPENHKAYRFVYKFYPEHQPDLALIRNPPKEVGGHWWETEAVQPTPEKCAPRSMGPHPINGS